LSKANLHLPKAVHLDGRPREVDRCTSNDRRRIIETTHKAIWIISADAMKPIV